MWRQESPFELQIFPLLSRRAGYTTSPKPIFFLVRLGKTRETKQEKTSGNYGKYYINVRSASCDKECKEMAWPHKHFKGSAE